MIAHWMLYCVAIGVLLSGGAVALDGALRPLGRPTRWVWAGAILLTLAIPAAVRVFGEPRVAPPAPVQAAGDARTARFGPGALTGRGERSWLADALDPQRLQRPLAGLWIVSSAVALAVLAGMGAALRRRRRGWTATEVDGVPVLVSADVGPAVVGLLRSRIVLPRWAMDADERARALVLEHEREHVQAGDPRLLAAALVAAVLTPWNPAVWWQLRRLRLAVEVDCDARVLRRRDDVHAYGSVLLEVGRRTSRFRLAASAAFAEPVSTLERRIRIMTAPRVRRPLLRAAGLGALAAVLAVAACSAPAPSAAPAPRASQEASRFPITPRDALAQYFPEIARDGMGENDILLFVVSADGRVIRHERVAKSASGQPAAWDNIPPAQIASVDVVKRPAGELAPSGVQMIWVRLKGNGDTPTGMVHIQAGDDGRLAVTTEHTSGNTAWAPTAAEIAAARNRYYTPEMEARGLTGDVRITVNYGPDGRPGELAVKASRPELQEVGQQIAAALKLRNGTPNSPAEVWIALGRQPVTIGR